MCRDSRNRSCGCELQRQFAICFRHRDIAPDRVTNRRSRVALLPTLPDCGPDQSTSQLRGGAASHHCIGSASARIARQAYSFRSHSSDALPARAVPFRTRVRLAPHPPGWVSWLGQTYLARTPRALASEELCPHGCRVPKQNREVLLPGSVPEDRGLFPKPYKHARVVLRESTSLPVPSLVFQPRLNARAPPASSDTDRQWSWPVRLVSEWLHPGGAASGRAKAMLLQQGAEDRLQQLPIA